MVIAPDDNDLPPMQALDFEQNDPESLAHAMARYMAMFDLVRDGAVNPKPGEIPSDLTERAQHLKAAGYYFDASMMGVCVVPATAVLAEPIRNPAVSALGLGFNRSMQQVG